MEYRICKRCVMDTTDPTIVFDENGYCNHCNDALKNKPITLEETDNHSFNEIINTLKQQGKGKKYDCILGISGGIDSSYLAYLLSKENLRILGVHIDAGWDTEISSRNLKLLCENCNIELKNIKINEEEMMDLQRSYFLSEVINQDVPQDHAFFAELYHYMIKEKQKYFISGHNWATESITPIAWGFDAYDSTNIKAIHKKYGRIKLKEYPFLSFYENRIKIPYIYKIKKLRPLNCIKYNPNEALKTLEKEVGFKYYGSKHNESVFTRLLQTYIQPKKYGFEKRRAHLSSMIVSGLISRDEAIKILEQPAESEEQIENDINVVTEKMKISREEFDKIINSGKIVNHLEFKNEVKKVEKLNNLKHLIKRTAKNEKNNN